MRFSKPLSAKLAAVMSILGFLAAPSLAAPAKPAAKPVARPVAKAPAKKPGRTTKKERVTQIRALLSQANMASKSAPVKQGIAAVLKLVDAKQWAPARDRVGELKRSAALAGEPSGSVLKLVEAENALDELADRAKKTKK